MKAVNGRGKRAQCNAHSAPLGKSLPCTSLPLRWLFCFSENCTTPKVASLSVVGHYRLSEIITGHLEWPSAKHYALGQTCFAGRHRTLPTGQFFLLKPVWQQQRADKALQCISSKCMHQPHSLSCKGLKGSWPSTLGPSITHFKAWWPKSQVCNFDIKLNTSTKHF